MAETERGEDDLWERATGVAGGRTVRKQGVELQGGGGSGVGAGQRGWIAVEV